MKTTEKLDIVVDGLGHSYSKWKEWEKEKEEDKAAFYQLANQSLRDRGLMTKVVSYPGSHEVAKERALRHNPGWEMLTEREDEDGWKFILIEDASLKAFSYEYNGVKYSRVVSRGSVMIDEEWLREEDPGLYDMVTFQLPWGERVAMPVEALQEAILAKLTKYTYNAKPKVSLGPPRPVNE